MSERNTPILRSAAATLIAGLLLPVGAYADDAEQSVARASTWSRTQEIAAIAFDVTVLRPLGFAVVAVGTAAFVPISVITAPNGLESIEEALELLVTGPAKDVFQRPLGEF